jgi:hypothetical protein
MFYQTLGSLTDVTFIESAARVLGCFSDALVLITTHIIALVGEYIYRDVRS